MAMTATEQTPEDWVPWGFPGKPESRTCVKVTGIIFNTIWLVEMHAVLITAFVLKFNALIWASFGCLTVCVFIYVALCSNFTVWHALLIPLRLLTWAITTGTLCLFASGVIILAVRISRNTLTAVSVESWIILYILVYALPFWYGFAAASLFPALSAYHYELRPAPRNGTSFTPTHMEYPQPPIGQGFQPPAGFQGAQGPDNYVPQQHMQYPT